MAQIEKLDKLQSIWAGRNEKQLEKIAMNKYLKYSLVVMVFSIFGFRPYYFVWRNQEQYFFFKWGNLPTPMPEDSVLVINQNLS
jgi:hypothetical protein